MPLTRDHIQRTAEHFGFTIQAFEPGPGTRADILLKDERRAKHGDRPLAMLHRGGPAADDRYRCCRAAWIRTCSCQLSYLAALGGRKGGLNSGPRRSARLREDRAKRFDVLALLERAKVEDWQEGTRYTVAFAAPHTGRII